MAQPDKLERYETTQAQDFLRLFAALRPPTTTHAPANFRAKVLERVEQRRRHSGWLVWLTRGWTLTWASALATGLLLSLSFNAWLGYQALEGGYRSHIGQGRGNIRAMMADVAADSVGHAFPTAEPICDYAILRALVNHYGGTLPESEAPGWVRFVSYETQDTEHDGVPDSYLLILEVINADGKSVEQLRVTPEGMERVPKPGASK